MNFQNLTILIRKEIDEIKKLMKICIHKIAHNVNIREYNNMTLFETTKLDSGIRIVMKLTIQIKEPGDDSI